MDGTETAEKGCAGLSNKALCVRQRVYLYVKKVMNTLG